jgi:uncharacterized protein involved in type VI secretion and phage assembly
MSEQFTLKINAATDEELSAAVMEWAVDTNIFLPSMFMVLIRDDDSESESRALKYVDNTSSIKIGAAVEISVSVTGVDASSSVTNQVFKGEITAIEPVFGENGSVQLRLRGFDKGHRLTLGKNTRTFGDANPQTASLTDSDIVSQIAQKAGLSANVSASGLSGVAYHYVMQYDQSDWEFLWARAQMLGYQVYVNDKTLHFRPASDKRHTQAPEALVWGQNLKHFEPRIVVSSQVTKSEALGWDPATQKKVSGTASSNSQPAAKIGDSVYGKKAVSGGLQMSSVAEAVLSPVMRSAKMAEALAKARFAEHESQFARASGELLFGDPRLLAGTVVKISNVGKRFSGEYYVTAARHSWRSGDYRVRFEVSGREPYTIRNLLLGREALSLRKIDGVVIGIVTDIGDPQKLGRVKVKYPWLPLNAGAELGSNWARLVTAGAGSDRGVFFTPEVNDEVLIAFEQGDVSHPYVVGALWSDKKKPPAANAGTVLDGGKTVNQRIIRSKSGHLIVLDDTDGQEKITIVDKTKKNTITIDSKTNAMTIKSEGDLTLEAGGKLVMKSKQDFSLETQAGGQIKAQSKLDMQGQTGAMVKAGSSQLDLQPATAALKSTKVDVQGQAQVSVQGAQTSVKGTAMVEIQGALVKIN